MTNKLPRFIALILLSSAFVITYHVGVENTKQSITNKICGSAAARMMSYGYNLKYDSTTDELAAACGHVRTVTGKDYHD